ncbi:OmpA family protein [Vibrio parahaemolyticus]|nr:OmpA family protein [Vibrio parahaemolyticus]MCR9656960.1 OmpA family protein [Vibrio parahaemolyticus]
MKLKTLTFAMIFATGFVNAANLEQDVDKSGFWLGAAAGMGVTNGSDITAGESEVLSPKIEMGYDFGKHFGLYGSYDYMHNLDDAELHLGTLGMKGNLYFTDNLSMYGKLGATYIFADGSELKTDSFSGTVGIGLEYQLTHSVTTKIGYDYYNNLEAKNGKDLDLSQVYWGMTYKFGQPDTPLVVEEKVEVPVEVVKEVTTTQVSRSTYTLPYQTGQVDVNDYGRYNLDEVVTTMRNNPELTADIVGRTDSTGSQQTNLRVSGERAQNVGQYLINQGIDAERIHTSGVADQQPLNNAQNAQLERSVQITLN